MGIRQTAPEFGSPQRQVVNIDLRQPQGERLSAWQERQAKQLLEANLNSGLSIMELARECGLSRCHFSRAFHGSTGMSPHQWLTRQRLQRAQQLLLGTRSIADIAQDCGFADQAHLSRVFTRQTGMPPSLWRLERLRRAS
ncbi:helix-turn-helix domain-containing protein [Pseudomonas sp. Gutcm_11s]|uniref:helix-turn-helix domain-containing protein n=1 Tax=Pseudomonas sp. Gutcm_11s TaxID=3026088 RepID=UPI00235E5246|nr:AraC family transcriptional regulator [Pseudomonas sp. Gutcm_11s]MDD0842725.1 AraC family transcriptional regulator [Pseudomonas sp. Gutcm_11s]